MRSTAFNGYATIPPQAAYYALSTLVYGIVLIGELLRMTELQYPASCPLRHTHGVRFDNSEGTVRLSLAVLAIDRAVAITYLFAVIVFMDKRCQAGIPLVR